MNRNLANYGHQLTQRERGTEKAWRIAKESWISFAKMDCRGPAPRGYNVATALIGELAKGPYIGWL